MTQLLPNPDFLKWLLEAIVGARRRVVLVNYLATLEEKGVGPVAKIADALAAAAKRGVKVEVVLEGSKFEENMAFYRSLKGAGIDTWMDTSLTFIHTKAVFIDDATLCIGSHNLSANALTRHEEASIATDDADAIARFKAELEKMTAQRREIVADVCREGAKLPVSIIAGSDGAAAPLVRIKKAIAPQAYLLYLLLCRLDGGTPRKITIDADAWAGELGFPPSTAAASVRIDATLTLLARKLGVVAYKADQKMVIRRSIIANKARQSRGGEILLPNTFWQFGWHTRLSVEAIHLYLAGEAERLASPFTPWWRQTRDEIAKKYGFQKQLVNRAQGELKKAGLFEVLFEMAEGLPEGRYARYRNYFRQNPFYDPRIRERQIAQFGETFGAGVLAKARDLAALVDEENDPQKLAALCEALNSGRSSRAASASRTIKGLAANSTKRTFEYVMEMVG